MTKTVSLYRCLSCGKLRICREGNYHPWCLACMNDQFDWDTGFDNLTEEEAERILKKEDE